jgi:phosphoribosyl 1,2-cyclic phosphate phosphodiesterase
MFTMQGKFTFLGTGASVGTPIIGCNCPVCLSSDPKNNRLRTSALIQCKGKTLLIDAGPDFRGQALRQKIHHLDGLLLTHTHFDHIAGIDELRVFYLRSHKAIPCLLSEESFQELKTRYHYFFKPVVPGGSLSAQLEFQLLEDTSGVVDFLGIQVRYFSYFQGTVKVTGFQIGDLAYISDIKTFDPAIFDELKGVNTLVLSFLEDQVTHFHLSLDEARAFANRVKPKQTYLIHMNHMLDHQQTNKKLPPNIQLAFDGQEVSFAL